MTDAQTDQPGIARILAAFGYDLVLLFGLLLLATTIVVMPAQLIFGIDTIGSHPLFRLLLLAVIVGFYLWFWTHGGQTLGMRAWRIKIVDKHHPSADINYRQAAIRFIVMLLSVGISTLWMLFNGEHESLHDKLAQSRLILLPKMTAIR